LTFGAELPAAAPRRPTSRRGTGHDRYGTGFDDVLLLSIAAALVVVALTVLTRALFMPRLIERETSIDHSSQK